MDNQISTSVHVHASDAHAHPSTNIVTNETVETKIQLMEQKMRDQMNESIEQMKLQMQQNIKTMKLEMEQNIQDMRKLLDDKKDPATRSVSSFVC